MARKFTGDFTGVPEGEVWPKAYAAGDDCPAELEVAADEVGVLGEDDGAAAAAEAKRTADEAAAEEAKKAADGKK